MDMTKGFFFNLYQVLFSNYRQWGIQLTTLVITLLFFAFPTKALDLENLSTIERDRFGELIKEYLLANPEIMLEVFQKLEEQQDQIAFELQSEFIELNADFIFNNPHSWVGGNPDGDVNLVEFVDYRCGFCRRAHPIIQDLLKLDPSLRFVIKEFPILGEDSLQSAKLAVAVLQLTGSEDYETVHSYLIRLQEPISDRVISEVASMTGIDGETLKTKMEDSTVTNVLESNYQLAQTLDINATPSFIVGNKVISGYLSLEEFRFEIDQIRTAQN